MGMFSGKTGLVMGLANDRSIAWAMSEALYAEGAAGVGVAVAAYARPARAVRLGKHAIARCAVDEVVDIAADYRLRIGE